MQDEGPHRRPRRRRTELSSLSEFDHEIRRRMVERAVARREIALSYFES